MVLLPLLLLRKLTAAVRLPAAPARPRPPLLLALLAALLLGSAAAAQVPTPPAPAGPELQKEPYRYVEQMPVYRHGRNDALPYFIERNRKWPQELRRTQGKVFVSFTITSEGEVRDAQVLKGLHPVLDAEAVRVVQLLDGQFLPGKHHGRPVAVSYTVVVPYLTK